jgi:hypothetical protein
MPLAEDAGVDRKALEGPQHVADVAGARRHGGGVGAVGWPGAAADQGGGAVGQRRLRLLRRYEVDVRVDARRGQDQVRTGDRVGGQPAFQAWRDPVHGLRVAGLADGADAAVLDAHVGLHHALHRVDDGDVGDDQVGRAAVAGQPVVHAHALAQALAAAEDDLVARRAAQVALDLDEQAGVAKADAVADRGAEQADVFIA